MKIQSISSYSSNFYAGKNKQNEPVEKETQEQLSFKSGNCIKNLKLSNVESKAPKMLDKIFTTKNKENVVKTLPIVSAPILLYDLRNTHTKKLLDELRESGVEIPTRISVSPVTDSGLSEASKHDVRDNILEAYKNNEIDEDTKNELLHRVTFTGDSEDSGLNFEPSDVPDTGDAGGIFDAIGDFFNSLFG